jgi:hypothetical protein
MSHKSKTVRTLQDLGVVKSEVKQVVPLLKNSDVENIFANVAKKFSCEDLVDAVALRDEAFMEMAVVTEIMADPRFADRAKVEATLDKAQAVIDEAVKEALHEIETNNPRYNVLKMMAQASPDAQAIFDEWRKEIENVVLSIKTDEALALELAKAELEDLRKTLDPMKADADRYAEQARQKFQKAEKIALGHGFSFKSGVIHPVTLKGKETFKTFKELPA